MREGLESKNKKREPTDEELEEAEGEDNAGGADPASVAIGAAMAGHEDDVSEDAAPVGRKAGKKAKANAKAKARPPMTTIPWFSPILRWTRKRQRIWHSVTLTKCLVMTESLS